MRIALLIFLFFMLVAGCVSSPGNALVYKQFGSVDDDDDGVVVRGVITGVYEWDPETTRSRLSRLDKHLSAEDVETLADRYVARVGIRRETVGTLFMPFYSRAHFRDFVLLPQGWSHDPFGISSGAPVLNVGDVVDIRIRRGAYFQHLEALVRKCSDTPVADELPEWALGCKTYDKYNQRGYAGEYYRFLLF